MTQTIDFSVAESVGSRTPLLVRGRSSPILEMAMLPLGRMGRDSGMASKLIVTLKRKDAGASR